MDPQGGEVYTMIELYTGTPGSGKSYSALLRILRRLNKKRYVVANFQVLTNERNKDYFIYLDNSELKVKKLVELSLQKGFYGKEGSCLLVIDEAQVIFNSRQFDSKDRLEWVKFFSQSRKLGYDIVLVTQNDRMIDRQIRTLAEYEVKHKNLRSYFWLSWLPLEVHVRVTYWYGEKFKGVVEFFIVRKRYFKYYDSYRMFDLSLANAGGLGDPQHLLQKQVKHGLLYRLASIFR